MGSASLEFVAYGLAAAIVLNLGRSAAWRQAVLLVASILYLGFFSHRAGDFIPLFAFLAYGFASVRALQAGAVRTVWPFVACGVLLFVWLKKYSFVPAGAYLQHPYLTLGLSYIFFRVLHLIVDARSSTLPGKVTLASYVGYTLNFTTLLCGPIQRYEDFLRMQHSPPSFTALEFGTALRRMIVGFFKVNVLALVFSIAQTDALAVLAGPADGLQRTSAAAVLLAAFPLFLYCNFSGYIDIVIGLARCLRIELPENFDRPFSSGNFMVFWSRWHITLSNWLKTYVYTPLLMALLRRWPSARSAPYFGVAAFFVTFFLVGVWHGQTSMFLFFGFLQGLGVSGVKLYQLLAGKVLGAKTYRALARHWLYVVVARGLTFTWFGFTLVWFWASAAQLDQLRTVLSTGELLAACGMVIIAASVGLGACEWARTAAYGGKAPLRRWTASRSLATVGLTTLTAISAAVVLLLNTPAPDIVYKAF